jgi:hypothetical protein
LRAKQKQLVKDLAKLLGKYSVRDWEPIVRLLRAGKSKIPELIEAIEELGRSKTTKSKKIVLRKKASLGSTKAKANKKTAKSARKRKARTARRVDAPTQEYQSADEHLEAWTKAMLVSSSLSELQELYFRAVGSKRLPPRRNAVIRALTNVLRHGTPAQRALLMNLLQRRSYDPTENYRRWTAMISRLKTNPSSGLR